MAPRFLTPVVRAPGQAASLARNAAEVARLGQLRPLRDPAPQASVRRLGGFELLRCFPDAPAAEQAVLLITPLVLSPAIWDVSESTSAARQLHEAGISPWIVRRAGRLGEAAGREQLLAEHAAAVDEAVDEVGRTHGGSLHLAGYGQSGMLAYLVAALRSSRGLAGVIGIGAPADLRAVAPLGLPPAALLVASGWLDVVGRTVEGGRRAAHDAARALHPLASMRRQAEFLLALHERDAMAVRDGRRRLLESGVDGQPWQLAADFVWNFVAQSQELAATSAIDGRLTVLAGVSTPVLAVIGDQDGVAPRAAVRPLARAAPRAEVWEAVVDTGHLGLIAGPAARSGTWPAVIEWMRWIDGAGPAPTRSRRMGSPAPRPGRRSSLAQPAAVARDLVLGASSGGLRTLTEMGGSARDLGREVLMQMARLSRLSSVRPTTRVSLARTLDEFARKEPDRVQFIFGDRAFTRARAKQRIDAVVTALAEIGVHQGEQVGVLMSSRPSAVAAVAALNRIGAVAVLLRPGGEVEREAVLGSVGRILCDPERVDEGRRAGLPVFVLGGGADRPPLPTGVVDLETLDVSEATSPGWYRPNPGRAMDVAFVVFTGEGGATRVGRITNKRWLLSALGTASAASLTAQDTVYGLAPLSHPAGLLVAVGGAIAGGARFVMAERFDPACFWDEVQRYGATVVSYTWRMVQPLVDAPTHPAERESPIRLFVGSGMPAELWRQAEERFAPSRVVDFYTAPDAEAVLVNLGGEKPGCLGRALPGSSPVRIVRWDEARARLARGASGMGASCGVGEVGMLMAKVDPYDPCTGHVAALRGVLEAQDAWIVTGDLARRDRDGDVWLVDAAAAVIDPGGRRRSPNAIAAQLEALGSVAAAVAYAVRADGELLAVAAVVPSPAGPPLSAHELDALALRAPSDAVADIVRVVAELPLSPWHRPLVGPLRDAAAIPASARRPAWRRDAVTGRYHRLRRRLELTARE